MLSDWSIVFGVATVDEMMPVNAANKTDVEISTPGSVHHRGRRLDISPAVRLPQELGHSLYRILEVARLLWVDRQGEVYKMKLDQLEARIAVDSGRLLISLIQHFLAGVGPQWHVSIGFLVRGDRCVVVLPGGHSLTLRLQTAALWPRGLSDKLPVAAGIRVALCGSASSVY